MIIAGIRCNEKGGATVSLMNLKALFFVSLSRLLHIETVTVWDGKFMIKIIIKCFLLLPVCKIFILFFYGETILH